MTPAANAIPQTRVPKIILALSSLSVGAFIIQTQNKKCINLPSSFGHIFGRYTNAFHGF